MRLIPISAHRALAMLLYAMAAANAHGESGRVEDMAFTATCDGSEQHYLVRWPEGFDAARPVELLVALHGHGSDRWQFMRDARDECRAARDVAEKHSMVYVCPDYRAKTSWMGPKAEADLLQILAELKARCMVRKTILCGGSMGGTGALSFAVLHPELVDGVAAMNGTANLLEYEGFLEAIAESYGGNKRDIPEVYKARSAEYFPERLSMPVGMSLGGRDEVVPPHSAMRLAGVLEKLGRPVWAIYQPEGGHATNYADACAIMEFARTGQRPEKSDPGQ